MSERHMVRPRAAEKNPVSWVHAACESCGRHTWICSLWDTPGAPWECRECITHSIGVSPPEGVAERDME